MRPPAFAEAARFWLKLGFISFGGPAGQIAIMHREVVERRAWIDERRFAGALNFCMLLPGPEALQLAIYLGWRLHGIRGGLVAGLGFILPAILLLFALALVYARYGQVPAVSGLLLGLKASVTALVLQALLRIGRRALHGPLHVFLAVAAFVALQWLGTPFPVIVLVAGLVGLASAWNRIPDLDATRPTDKVNSSAVRIAVMGALLWTLPLIALGAWFGFDTLFTELYLFFTRAALVTFGGAYAVLPYVTHYMVEDMGWLSAQQAVAGLALAETTPGPLIIVLQFMGFMAGWNEPAPLGAATAAFLAGAIASWATFLPSFLFIFLGAPYVERIAGNPRAAGALAAITAAVVGIIGTLALFLAQAVLFPAGIAAAPSWPAVLIALGTFVLLHKTKLDLLWILGAAALAGLAATLLT
jgi:chromate transporter